MEKRIKQVLRFAVLVVMMSLTGYVQAAISIIPEPVQMQPASGTFEMTAATAIVADDDLYDLALQFQQELKPALGHELKIVSDSPKTNYIQIKRRGNLGSLGSEGYQMSVTAQRILIESSGQAGLFYGLQTFRQLLPTEIYGPSKATESWQVPCAEITDYPRFKWRGMHLDVGRHYMPPEFVKKYIDLLAMHKMNTFHWHLTEDQGWRIEIKKYPKLAEVAAFRKETVIGRNSGQYDGKPHGGFYTQDQIRDIVAYAKQRYITIVPEIEMPGHSRAVLAAYPELSCTGGLFEVKTNWGVEQEVYCAGNDQVYEFLENVLDEVLEMFPSEFIHIGGDECPKKRWEQCLKCQDRIKTEDLKDEHELQSWFIKRMEKYLNAHGRRLIGWDEILEGGLAPNATVMSWRGESGGIAAAKSGHDVVMAPNGYTYFDHYQALPQNEPLAIGGFLPLEKVYGYDPVPAELTDAQKAHILGVQAQIWTEYIATPDYAEYMAYPRGCALAEVAWSPLSVKDYDSFYQRLQTHLDRLQAMDVNFRPLDPPKIVAGQWKSGQTSETFKSMQWDVTSLLDQAGTYEVIFQYTSGAHRLDIQSVELLNQNKNERVAVDEHPGITGGSTKNNVYVLKVNVYDPSARYLIRAVVRSDGGTDSNGHIYIRKSK